MRLLLDAHIAVWAALEPENLTAAERKHLEADTPIVLSSVTIWELRLKWNNLHLSGTRKGPVDPADMIAFAEEVGLELLSLTAAHAAASLAQPLGHKDPFDELLLVQAQEEGMRLLTRDAKLAGHPCAVGLAGTQEKNA